MSEVFKGFVGKINEKSGTGRRGPWTLYSTKLQGPDGKDSSDWISFGFEKPKVKTGDYVKITVEENGRGNLEVQSAVKLKNPPARTSSSSSDSGSGDSGSGSRQASIHYQSSRNAAIAAVALLVEADALELPKATTKPGAAKRFKIIKEAIDKFTVQYFNDLETMRLLEIVADAGVVNTKPDADLPDSDANSGSDSDEEEEDEEEDEIDDEEEEEEEE